MSKKLTPIELELSEQEPILHVTPENTQLETVLPVDEAGKPNPDGYFVDESPDTYPNERLGIPTPPKIAENFANMPDEWKERNGIPVENRVPTAASPEVQAAIKLLSGKSDEPVAGKLLTPGEIRQINLKSPSAITSKVGAIVLFQDSPALVTKVWDNGLVNLTVFKNGLPVPDLKISVPYGDGPDTWKELD